MSEAYSFQEPTIDVRSPQSDVALVVLGGEHDLNSAAELRQALERSLAVCDHLIVDLEAVEYIDSTIIHVLVETHEHAVERDRTFSIVLGSGGIVERVLDVSGVLRRLNVVPSVERALDAAVVAPNP